MTRVYLARHGETEWNKELRFRGRADIPLNQTGHRQAKAIADALADKEINAIYTSPLQRSIETALPTADLFGLRSTTVQGLIDISYGQWEGLGYGEVQKQYANLYHQWEEYPEAVKFPEGESLDEVRERSFSAFKDAVAENSDKSILVIPHRVINKVLLCAILGLSNAHFWLLKQDTGCINVIEHVDNRFVLVKMNDTCHLKGMSPELDQVDF
ncbi:MAG: histidine phosphatase family protein [Thermodesulfobacteriota bacterium]